MADFNTTFIKPAVHIFDSCVGVDNRFIVCARDVSEAREFLADCTNTEVFERSSFGVESLAEHLAWCDCIVVHYLNSWKAEVVLRAPRVLPVVWSGWGHDYFTLLPNGGPRLLGSETRRMMDVLDRRRSHFGMRLVRAVKSAAVQALGPSKIEEAISRVDVFSCPFPGDVALLQAHFGDDFPREYSQLNYGSVMLTCEPGPASVNGDDILIGNSASPTNNHLEVFRILSRLSLADRRVVVPLSYGDAVYRDAIIEHGRRLFGDRFVPVVDMLPLEQYNTLIATCSVAVMGHRRQEGAGTTVTMLYKGARAYMDEASSVFQYLKSRGAFVGSLQDLQSAGQQAFDTLTADQKRRNREVLEAYLGHETVVANVGRLVDLVRQMGMRKRLAVM